MGLFGPPNIEKMESWRDMKGLIKALSYENSKDLSAESSLRASACHALGRLGDSQATEALLIKLVSGVEVGVAAAEALGMIADPRSLDKLLDATQKQWINGNVQEAAADAFVKISMQDVASLEKGLWHGHNKIRLAVARRLKASGWRPRNDETSALYAILQADWVLLRSIGVPSLGPLLELLDANQERYWDLRGAYKCLMSLAPVVPDTQLKKRIVDVLQRTIRLPDPELENLMMQILGPSFDLSRLPTETKAMLKTTLKEPHQKAELAANEIRSDAIAALEAMGPEGVDALSAVLEADLQAFVYGRYDYKITEFLAQLSDKRAVELFKQIIKRYSAKAPMATIIGVLVNQGDDETILFLIDIGQRIASRTMMDTGGDLFNWVQAAIHKFGSRAIPHLKAAMNQAPPEVQKSLCVLLGKAGGNEAEETLINILKSEKNLDLFEAACDALSELSWEPTQSREGALFYAIRKEWWECRSMGEQAISALLFIMKSGKEKYDDRPRKAAETLKAIYAAGDLSDNAKTRLLALVGTRYTAHDDYNYAEHDCEFHHDKAFSEFQL